MMKGARRRYFRESSGAWMEYNTMQEVREESSPDCIRATLLKRTEGDKERGETWHNG
jgi:hypothetical protein